MSMGRASKPGYFFGSTMNAVADLGSSRSVLASSTPVSVSLARDANIFEPVSR
jgi:hypothetical protein